MTDMERAVALLEEKDASIVVVAGEREFVSHASGVAPLLELLDKDPALLRDASAADRIIGRASALLMIRGGVREAYGKTVSAGAVAVMAAHGVPIAYGEITERIMNRLGTDTCPMEKCVADIDDPETARAALAKRHAELKANRG